jgi:hypothetical protein
VIDFLYLYQNDPTVSNQWLRSLYIRNGLYKLLDCLPWKIGVIYNYTNNDNIISHVEIMVGGSRAYKIGNKYFKTTWLNSEQTKLTVREVVSLYNKPVNSSISLVTTDPKLDQEIRKQLISHNVATINTCMHVSPIGTSFKSYPDSHYLSHREKKEIYPCSIEIENFNHDLTNHPGFVPSQTFTVPIQKGSIIEKIKSLLERIPR